MPNSQFYVKEPMIRSVIHELRAATSGLVAFLTLEKGPQKFIQAGNDILARLENIRTNLDRFTETPQIEEVIQEGAEALNKIAIDMSQLAKAVSETESYTNSENIQYTVELIYNLINLPE